MKFIDWEITETPNQKHFRKVDMIPLPPRPKDWIDPYPEFQLEDIVAIGVFSIDYKFEGREISGVPLKLGDEIAMPEKPGLKFYVTARSPPKSTVFPFSQFSQLGLSNALPMPHC